MPMEMRISPTTVSVTPTPRQTATCQRGMLPGSTRPGDRNLSMRRGLTAIGVETAIMSDATTTTALAAIGIPASFVIIATVSIVGLGWGRATRTATAREAVAGDPPSVSVGALTADDAATIGDAGGGGSSPPIGEENVGNIPAASDLFDPETTGRVILMQNVVPATAMVGASLVFRLLSFI